MTNHVTACDVLDEAGVIARLEAAGKCLLSLPDRGFSPRLKQKRYDVVRSVWEAYASSAPGLRPAVPGAREIDAMDEAIAWLDLIPAEWQASRNVVRARMFVHPLNDRHLYTWTRIAREMHTDAKQVQRYHEKGIKKIFLGIAKNAQTAL